MTPRFAVTFDYRCPFARIGHLHVLAGLRDGADWDVTFVPFSLGQMHVEEGQPDVWERPEEDSGLLALQVGTVVRDRFPEQFPAVHTGLFDARHVRSADLRDRDVLTGVLADAGVDAGAVFDEVAGGGPLDTVHKEHDAVVAEADVWGVPTYVVDGRAAFVRLMEPPTDDADGRRSIERILELMTGWPQLNEFKYTTIPR
jgi:hypothetical protein